MTEISFHPVDQTSTFVDVILPIATPKPYTYRVPEELIPNVKPGIRVEVQFGQKKLYSGLIYKVHQEAPKDYRPKLIGSLIDEDPIVYERQFKFWAWIASYYGCTLGEVMHAALPANFKLTSETRITLGPLFNQDTIQLDDQEYLVAEALTIQEALSIEDIQGILQKKTVYPVIRRLLDKKVIYLIEDLKERYKPRTVSCVRLREEYTADPDRLSFAFDLVSRSEKQTKILLAFIQIYKQREFVRKQDLIKMTGTDHGSIKAMEKKQIFELYGREVSRLGSYEESTIEANEPSDQQVQALAEIKEHWEDKQSVLLHGVTGSGKTRVYVELMKEVVAQGGQVLYLLPEIALTAQIVGRLQKIFGDDIAVYHSRQSHNERVELWGAALSGKPIMLGARSASFLPYKKLDLIIIDEEHDPSYKQNNPAPRYQGRDTALVLAQLHEAKVILGTATPSLESYHNAQKGKYGLVKMPERFGGLALPETIIVDAKKELKEKKLQSHFTSVLIEALRKTLENGEQAILFQNRRGYAPSLRCDTCGWHSECSNCDVTLTYHKGFDALKCHYCGYQTKIPESCPACGAKTLSLKGFGTEKIEDELKIFLPDAKIARMDLDTVRAKNAHARLISSFEDGQIDILVGTQMVTKGLDFERVGVVGVLSADQLLHYPDFRATERAFQLMVQVSGRAGRKHKRGKVIIQSFNPAHPILKEVIENDYQLFFHRELNERLQFAYPPFRRLIRISVKHRKPETLNQAMKLYAHWIKAKLGDWVLGPTVPQVGRIRGWFILDLLIKLDPKERAKLAFTKKVIRESTEALHQTKGYSGVRVVIDVDPY